MVLFLPFIPAPITFDQIIFTNIFKYPYVVCAKRYFRCSQESYKAERDPASFPYFTPPMSQPREVTQNASH